MSGFDETSGNGSDESKKKDEFDQLEEIEDDDIKDWMKSIHDMYMDKPSRKEKWPYEGKHLPTYLKSLRNNLPEQYKIVEPEFMGGTAVICRLKQLNTNQDLALKFNRPLENKDAIEMVKNESKTLPSLDNEYIIRVIDKDNISFDDNTPGLNYLIEPFIEDALDLDDYVDDRLGDINLPKTTEEYIEEGMDGRVTDVDDLLNDLTTIFRKWAEALDYLHNQGYIHCDVKPENVIVTQSTEHVELIDLGSVQDYDPDSEEPVMVFFTRRYSHPFLRSDELETEPTSMNRLKATARRRELKYKLDYFALGVSILETLERIAEKLPHDCPQLPLFKSLHLIGTRLLCGFNGGEGPYQNYDYSSRTFRNLQPDDYHSLQYSNLEDVIRDFEKEEGLWIPEDRIPELEAYSDDVMRINPDMNVPLTPRLVALFEHPLFARLKLVTQLGLIRHVYPTADHARYDHVLGTYAHTVEYIKALFYDKNNPLFRNLVNKEDIETLLVASLVHDLGHYPLAHDLEEVDNELFGHMKMTTEFLEDQSVTDEEGNSIGDIIRQEWEVNLGRIEQILKKDSRLISISPGEDQIEDFKVDLFSAILDGPIDSDKADYILRDSMMCGIPYGEQLDLDRLLRVMTVVRLQDADAVEPRVTLGVYEKGSPAAHAFTQARYELYSAVYWQHTARIIKSMIQYSVCMWLYKGNLSEDQKEETHHKLRAFVKGINPTNEIEDMVKLPTSVSEQDDIDITAEPAEDPALEISERATLSMENSKETTKRHPGASWTDDLLLRWIQSQPEAGEKVNSLLRMVRSRDLYKRVTKISLSADEDLANSIRGLSYEKRLELCEKVQNKLYNHLVEADFFEEDESNLATDTMIEVPRDEIERIFEEELAILIDAPDPNDIGFDRDRPLVTVPEVKSKTYYQDLEGPQSSEEWKSTAESLMQNCAPVRVVCHPKLRKVVNSQIRQEEIRDYVDGLAYQIR